MRIGSRIPAVALSLLVLAAFVVAGEGCGSSSSDSPQWTEVVTSDISGKAPVKLNLGTHRLGTKVRLAWDLNGPEDPPVILTFRVINADYGTGFGYSLTPTDPGFRAKSESAMTIGPIKPGNFTVYFSQRFAAADGPGYNGTITVYTLE